jgi:hypothetical protein
MLAAMLSSLSDQQAEIRFGMSASGNAKPKAAGRDPALDACEPLCEFLIRRWLMKPRT